MTNSIALTLAVLLCALIIGDYIVYGAEHLLFLGKKFFGLLDWMAFWR
ncbi:hypothetical protein [Puniceibacterium confluentis]|nr:hypothetical protein [Puniceibacterium confluentis]